MTSSPSVGVRGSQRPRVESVPTAAYRDSGDDAIALSAAAGLVLDPWQEHVLRGMLGERLDYKWAAPEACLVVPRQQGKGSIIEARELAGLFLFEEKLILHTAHELKTAQQAFQRIRSLVEQTPELDRQVAHMYTGNTENAIHLHDGRVLRFIARSKGSGRGFSADTVILDEAYALKHSELAALMPTLTTAKNAQLIYASSAGMPDSEVLAEIRERGMSAKTKGLAYFEWSAPDDADIDDMDALIAANPGLGIRMSMDHVATERAAMDDETFKRERLGQWSKIGGDSKVSDSDWSACLDPESLPGEFASFAIDIPPDRASANVAVISKHADGTLHGQILERRDGVSWVPDFLRELQVAWGTNATPVVVDAGSAAGSLIPELERKRVRLMFINAKQHGQACAQVYDDIVERRMVHRGQVELDEAVRGSKTKPLGDSAWKWAKTDATADISPLIALTLARHGWSTRGERKASAAERQSSGRSGGRVVRGRKPVGRGGGR